MRAGACASSRQWSWDVQSVNGRLRAGGAGNRGAQVGDRLGTGSVSLERGPVRGSAVRRAVVQGGVRPALGGGWDECPVKRMRPEPGPRLYGCVAGDEGAAEISKEQGAEEGEVCAAGEALRPRVLGPEGAGAGGGWSCLRLGLEWLRPVWPGPRGHGQEDAVPAGPLTSGCLTASCEETDAERPRSCLRCSALPDGCRTHGHHWP